MMLRPIPQGWMGERRGGGGVQWMVRVPPWPVLVVEFLGGEVSEGRGKITIERKIRTLVAPIVQSSSTEDWFLQ